MLLSADTPIYFKKDEYRCTVCKCNRSIEFVDGEEGEKGEDGRK